MSKGLTEDSIGNAVKAVLQWGNCPDWRSTHMRMENWFLKFVTRRSLLTLMSDILEVNLTSKGKKLSKPEGISELK